LVWIGAAATSVLLVVATVAIVSSSYSPTVNLSAQYTQVLNDANNVRRAMLTKDEKLYFEATAAIKKSHKSLQGMVPAEQLDTRPISSLAWGNTELYWSDPVKKGETFLQRSVTFFESEATVVKNEAKKDYEAGVTDAKETGAALEATAKFVETHTLKEDEKAAVQFIQGHYKWAKNKLCNMAAGEVFDEAVDVTTASAAAALCATTICPTIATTVDALGGGPMDGVADAVSAALDGACDLVCVLSVDFAAEVVARQGVSLISKEGVDAFAAKLCQDVHCGPVANN